MKKYYQKEKAPLNFHKFFWCVSLPLGIFGLLRNLFVTVPLEPSQAAAAAGTLVGTLIYAVLVVIYYQKRRPLFFPCSTGNTVGECLTLSDVMLASNAHSGGSTKKNECCKCEAPLESPQLPHMDLGNTKRIVSDVLSGRPSMSVFDAYEEALQNSVNNSDTGRKDRLLVLNGILFYRLEAEGGDFASWPKLDHMAKEYAGTGQIAYRIIKDMLEKGCTVLAVNVFGNCNQEYLAYVSEDDYPPCSGYYPADDYLHSYMVVKCCAYDRKGSWHPVMDYPEITVEAKLDETPIYLRILRDPLTVDIAISLQISKTGMRYLVSLVEAIGTENAGPGRAIFSWNDADKLLQRKLQLDQDGTRFLISSMNVQGEIIEQRFQNSPSA